MLALLQRVTNSKVIVNEETIGSIDIGLLVLVGIQKEDTEKNARRLLERLLGYRVFEDDKGRMNLSLEEVKGGLLLVPQFTLAADTNSGMRPSFATARDPEEAEVLFNQLVVMAKEQYEPVATGKFGAFMSVELVNDGPVTFLLQA